MAKMRNVTLNTDLAKLRIKNTPHKDFARKIREIPDGDYEVEDISDGRKIVITKPGRKGKWDFMVYIYDPAKVEQNGWRISHRTFDVE